MALDTNRFGTVIVKLLLLYSIVSMSQSVRALSYIYTVHPLRDSIMWNCFGSGQWHTLCLLATDIDVSIKGTFSEISVRLEKSSWKRKNNITNIYFIEWCDILSSGECGTPIYLLKRKRLSTKDVSFFANLPVLGVKVRSLCMWLSFCMHADVQRMVSCLHFRHRNHWAVSILSSKILLASSPIDENH